MEYRQNWQRITLLLICTAASYLSSIKIVQAEIKPNVVVSSISTFPGGVCTSKKIRINIKNNQNVGTGDKVYSKLTLSQPGRNETSIEKWTSSKIGPGATKSVTFSDIQVESGYGPVTVTAHANHKTFFPETDHADNTKTVTLNCFTPVQKPKPDLKISSVKWFSPVCRGDTLHAATAYITVKNLSNLVDSRGSNITIKQHSEIPKILGEVMFRRIGIGSAISVKAKVDFNRIWPGRDILVYVDGKNLVDEEKENNNNYTVDPKFMPHCGGLSLKRQ